MKTALASILVLFALMAFAQPVRRGPFTTNEVGATIDAASGSISNAVLLSATVIVQDGSTLNELLAAAGGSATSVVESLTVSNADYAAIKIQNDDTGYTDNDGLQVGYNGTSPFVWLKEAHTLYVVWGAAASVYPIVIGADGNVGIRDFTPDVAFSVTGDAAVSGTLTAGTFDGAFDGSFSGTHSGTWAGTFSSSSTATVSNLVVAGEYPEILLDSTFSGSDVRLRNENGVLYIFRDSLGKENGLYITSTGIVLQDDSNTTMVLGRDSGQISLNQITFQNVTSYTVPNTAQGSTQWSSNGFAYITCWVQGDSTNTTLIASP